MCILFSFLFVHAIVFARIFHPDSSWRSKFSNVCNVQCEVQISRTDMGSQECRVSAWACSNSMSLCIRIWILPCINNTSSMVAYVWSAFVFLILCSLFSYGWCVRFGWLFSFKCLILLWYNVRYPFYYHYHTYYFSSPVYLSCRFKAKTSYFLPLFFLLIQTFVLSFSLCCLTNQTNVNQTNCWSETNLKLCKIWWKSVNKRHKEWNQHSLVFLCVCMLLLLLLFVLVFFSIFK